MFKSLPLEQMELMADSCFLLLKKSLGDALKKNHINVICSQTSKMRILVRACGWEGPT